MIKSGRMNESVDMNESVESNLTSKVKECLKNNSSITFCKDESIKYKGGSKNNYTKSKTNGF